MLTCQVINYSGQHSHASARDSQGGRRCDIDDIAEAQRIHSATTLRYEVAKQPVLNVEAPSANPTGGAILNTDSLALARMLGLPATARQGAMEGVSSLSGGTSHMKLVMPAPGDRSAVHSNPNVTQLNPDLSKELRKSVAGEAAGILEID